MSSVTSWPGLQVRVLAVFLDIQFPDCRNRATHRSNDEACFSNRQKTDKGSAEFRKSRLKRWVFGNNVCLVWLIHRTSNNSRSRNALKLEEPHKLTQHTPEWWWRVYNLGNRTLLLFFPACQQEWCSLPPPLPIWPSLVPGFFPFLTSSIIEARGHHGCKSLAQKLAASPNHHQGLLLLQQKVLSANDDRPSLHRS